jgi:hypothetical protein
MTTEQARQEAEIIKNDFLIFPKCHHKAKRCALISINREIELLEEFKNESARILNNIYDLNQIKDELLKM